MLAILDYGAGNQTSVARALEHLGTSALITGDPAALGKASGVIFPGVGSAGHAMANLRKNGMDKALADIVKRGQPLLGICLGCQILLSDSDEDSTPALDIIPGHCRAFPTDMSEADGNPCRVPHMGWNSISKRRASLLLDGIDPEAEFYFVHSYYVEPPKEMIIATTTHGMEFCSIYGRDGLWAVQFHLEKSGEPGLRMLNNFYNYCKGRSHVV